MSKLNSFVGVLNFELCLSKSLFWVFFLNPTTQKISFDWGPLLAFPITAKKILLNICCNFLGQKSWSLTHYLLKDREYSLFPLRNKTSLLNISWLKNSSTTNYGYSSFFCWKKTVFFNLWMENGLQSISQYQNILSVMLLIWFWSCSFAPQMQLCTQHIKTTLKLHPNHSCPYEGAGHIDIKDIKINDITKYKIV